MGARANSSRWNLRVPSDDDIVVRRAADESDRELSEFVRTAAVLEAEGFWLTVRPLLSTRIRGIASW